MGNAATIVLPVGVAYEADDVIRVIARDYPSVVVAPADGGLLLSSPDHSTDCLTAIAWAAAARCALAPSSSQSQTAILDYLLW